MVNNGIVFMMNKKQNLILSGGGSMLILFDFVNMNIFDVFLQNTFASIFLGAKVTFEFQITWLVNLVDVSLKDIIVAKRT